MKNLILALFVASPAAQADVVEITGRGTIKGTGNPCTLSMTLGVSSNGLADGFKNRIYYSRGRQTVTVVSGNRPGEWIDGIVRPYINLEAGARVVGNTTGSLSVIQPTIPTNGTMLVSISWSSPTVYLNEMCVIPPSNIQRTNRN